MDLIKHLEKQKTFSEKTFGPVQTAKGIIEHIKKELVEIEENPTDLEEWIDVVLLACDGAWRAGYSPEEIAKKLTDKLEKNTNRVWPDWRELSPDSAIEHKEVKAKIK